MIICICKNLYQQSAGITVELFQGAVGIRFVVLLIMSLMVPLQIKYGADRSRVVLIVVMGLMGGAVIGLKKITEGMNLPSILCN